MTEEEWLTGDNMRRLVSFASLSGAGRRKLRLFSVSCCLLIQTLRSDPSCRNALSVAERFADGITDAKELASACKKATRVALANNNSAGRLHASLDLAAAHAAELNAVLGAKRVAQTVHDGAVLVAVGQATTPPGPEPRNQMAFLQSAVRDPQVAAGALVLQKAIPDLLRHIVGNPFRPYPAPPSWPSDVVRLAEALYQDTDTAFALADALLEAGHPELAEHFRAEAWHPRGCWAVDAITGRT